MKNKIKNKQTLQESLRRFGHMLAAREARGDTSEDYASKKALHESMLRKLYNRP
ncbi:MAG: hypothetical protein MUQ75_07675 [Crocinitomicaceae bacterium]|jgi:hypothetical protein|nr:hypothetical protein [Crocinitomicaceae bacterium]